jgi:hypothetical protein
MALYRLIQRVLLAGTDLKRQASPPEPRPSAADVPDSLQASVEAAIAVILDEHQDWNLLVRPHHLPLA